MISLGIETSTSHGSLALFSDKKLLGAQHWSRLGSHSEHITTSFQKLLNDHRLDVKQIERIGVGIGPGSFTGIRVGINFARALAYSLNIQIFNLNSLELLCFQSQLISKNDFSLLIVQYAFRDIAYACEYFIDQGRVVTNSKVEALTPNTMNKRLSRPILVLGTGFDILKAQLDPQKRDLCIRDSSLYDLPQAQDFLHTALTGADISLLNPWNQTIPLYIRASEAEEKLKKDLL